MISSIMISYLSRWYPWCVSSFRDFRVSQARPRKKKRMVLFAVSDQTVFRNGRTKAETPAGVLRWRIYEMSNLTTNVKGMAEWLSSFVLSSSSTCRPQLGAHCVTVLPLWFDRRFPALRDNSGNYPLFRADWSNVTTHPVSIFYAFGLLRARFSSAWLSREVWRCRFLSSCFCNSTAAQKVWRRARDESHCDVREMSHKWGLGSALVHCPRVPSVIGTSHTDSP